MIGEGKIEKRIYKTRENYSDNDRRCMLYKGRVPTY